MLLLWLSTEDLAALEHLAKIEPKPIVAMIASGLQSEDLSFVPDAVRDLVHITHPYSIPEDKRRTAMVVKRWLKIRKIPERNPRIESKMYFLATMLSAALWIAGLLAGANIDRPGGL